MSKGYTVRMSGENNPNYKKAGYKKCNLCEETYHSYNSNRKYCSVECSTIKGIISASIKLSREKIKSLYKERVKKKRKKHIIKKPARVWRCIKCDNVVKRKRKYCSRNCRTANYKQTVKCAVCKKEINRYKCELKKVKIYFCSSKCRWLKPEHNANWRGGVKELSSLIRSSQKNRNLIKVILKRDNFTCQKCGQIGGKLEVDHIKKFSIIFHEFKTLNKNKKEKDKYTLLELALKYKPFWDQNNLQTLCKGCNWHKELDYRSSYRKQE